MSNWNTRSRPAAAPALNLDCILLTMSATEVMVDSFVLRFSHGSRRSFPVLSIGDKIRVLQQFQMRVAVEGSQGQFVTTEFRQTQRRIDDLPVEFESLDRRHADHQLKGRSDGAAG